MQARIEERSWITSVLGWCFAPQFNLEWVVREFLVTYIKELLVKYLIPSNSDHQDHFPPFRHLWPIPAVIYTLPKIVKEPILIFASLASMARIGWLHGYMLNSNRYQHLNKYKNAKAPLQRPFFVGSFSRSFKSDAVPPSVTVVSPARLFPLQQGSAVWDALFATPSSSSSWGTQMS